VAAAPDRAYHAAHAAAAAAPSGAAFLSGGGHQPFLIYDLRFMIYDLG
jgi:hypothetical protein